MLDSKDTLHSHSRFIMHVDMDAFFASIEQIDNPELYGKPLAVGGGTRGVVCTASYEARRFGVHSAMPVRLALRLCPKLILVKPRMARYVEVSRQVMNILKRFSPCVEQASVDEAYLDATGLERLFGSVESLAHQVKDSVRKETGGLTCSVGVAPVKFLAKIASDRHKPNGLTIIWSEDVPSFVRSLAVSDIPGVGKAFLEALTLLGVRRCGDVLNMPRAFWEQRFGKAGIMLWTRAQGIDTRPVVSFRPPKSESAENTFDTDTLDYEFMKAWLYRHSDRVGKELRRKGLMGRVVTLKIKYADFSQITRQLSLNEPTCATQTIYESACKLLDMLAPKKLVRLVGVGVSGFGYENQGFLPLSSSTHEEEMRRTRLDKVLDSLGGKVVRGRMLTPASKK